MHRTLRVGGMLVDCRPVPQPASIAVLTRAGSTQVGQLEYSSDFARTIANAEEALASLGRKKLFERQRSVEYRLLIHFKSVSQWQEHLAKWADDYEPMPEGFQQAIEDLAGVPGTEIVLDTKRRSTTFKKLG